MKATRRTFLRNGLWLFGAPAIVKAQNIMPGPITRPMAAGGAPSYLLQENFEDVTVGWDDNNANGWTNSSANPKYTTVVLAGDQSLACGQDSYCYAPFTATTPIWIYCLYHGRLMDMAAETIILMIRTTAGGWPPIAYITFDGSNEDKLSLYQNTTFIARTVTAMATDTTYRIWLHYEAGTGANAKLDAEFQAVTDSRVGSGDNYVGTTTGTGTDTPGRIYLYHDRAPSSQVNITDTIRVSSTGYFVP